MLGAITPAAFNFSRKAATPASEQRETVPWFMPFTRHLDLGAALEGGRARGMRRSSGSSAMAASTSGEISAG